MPMKYRQVVKPLTEKTANAPFTGEILVNTEDGHISVATRKGVKSATRELEAQLLVKQVIVEKTTETLRGVLAKLNNETIPYFTERIKALGTVENTVNTLATTIDNLLAELVRTNGYVDLTTRNLLELYLLISKLAVTMGDSIDLIIRLEEANAETHYLEGVISRYHEQLQADLRALKTLKDRVTANVDSRVYEYVFNTWKREFMGMYDQLKSISKVDSLSFTHNR